MRQAIRALGWATKILWITLIVFVITIAYSATQIHVALGEPQATATEQTVTISFPIDVRNNGFYDITQFNITTLITDQNNQPLARGMTYYRLIPRNTNGARTHNIIVNINEILTQNNNLLFNDAMLTLSQHVSFSYANIIPLTVHADQELQWGAPLSNLAVNQVTCQDYNATHSLIGIHLSFENHNQYIAVAGTVRMEIYNSSQELMGAGVMTVEVLPNNLYNGQINLLIENSQITPTGQIRLFFETAAFNFGPVTLPYNINLTAMLYD